MLCRHFQPKARFDTKLSEITCDREFFRAGTGPEIGQITRSVLIHRCQTWTNKDNAHAKLRIRSSASVVSSDLALNRTEAVRDGSRRCSIAGGRPVNVEPEVDPIPSFGRFAECLGDVDARDTALI